MDENSFLCQVPIKQVNIFDVDGVANEVTEIVTWVKNLVNDDESMYTIRYRTGLHSLNSRGIDIWFRKQEHAMLCTLRWS